MPNVYQGVTSLFPKIYIWEVTTVVILLLPLYLKRKNVFCRGEYTCEQWDHGRQLKKGPLYMDWCFDFLRNIAVQQKNVGRVFCFLVQNTNWTESDLSTKVQCNHCDRHNVIISGLGMCVLTPSDWYNLLNPLIMWRDLWMLIPLSLRNSVRMFSYKNYLI